MEPPAPIRPEGPCPPGLAWTRLGAGAADGGLQLPRDRSHCVGQGRLERRGKRHEDRRHDGGGEDDPLHRHHPALAPHPLQPEIQPHQHRLLLLCVLVGHLTAVPPAMPSDSRTDRISVTPCLTLVEAHGHERARLSSASCHRVAPIRFGETPWASFASGREKRHEACRMCDSRRTARKTPTDSCTSPRIATRRREDATVVGLFRNG